MICRGATVLQTLLLKVGRTVRYLLRASLCSSPPVVREAPIICFIRPQVLWKGTFPVVRQLVILAVPVQLLPIVRCS